MCGRFVSKTGVTIERYLNVRPHQYKLSDRRPKGWWRDTMEANIRLLRRRAAIARLLQIHLRNYPEHVIARPEPCRTAYS
ncbi:MAG TPA: hypothetical protein VHJ19_12950 [Gammaproteobacteria bacterium]|nr:hypothetical protein [Gammaproteobacteria bacterium]